MCVVEVQTGACVLSGQQNKIVIHLHRKMKLSSIIRLSRSGWTHALAMAFFFVIVAAQDGQFSCLVALQVSPNYSWLFSFQL